MSAPEDNDAPGVPEWVVTYGDMMSLLLTFFIMLVSMSELKQDGHHRAMMDAIRQRFGPGAGLSGIFGRSLQSNSASEYLRSQGTRSEGGIKRFSRRASGSGGPNTNVQRINHGTVVTLGGPAVFEPAEANLSDDLRRSLDIIARVIARKPNRLIVRGHATAEVLPSDSPYKDPMDLSFARAANVARYVIGRGIDRRRIHVSAVGASEPWMLSRQKQVQNQNRRVDVFVIDSYISASQSAEDESD